ncbi:hypothetical protein [Pseudomonas abietaniphila]|uniref:hypothetical protein n=1 Tax=Pseudomonas abietaniphila TaxID=89065 RepID=UPI000783BCF1|nr:hypothetical protein [Pseudomonas abietaniphila]
MSRNIQTREGYEFWDRLNAIPHYGFLLNQQGNGVIRAEGVGDWIERHAAQVVVDDAQSELNMLREEFAKLDLELKKAKNLIKEMDLSFGRNLLAMRCAVIEWEKGQGAKAGMDWIYNTLRGPGELPPDDATDAQSYFNKQIQPIEKGLEECHTVRESLRQPLNPA